MSDIYLCIHGHFYQPPRENPWLGVIEVQPSARPYHDWNERITRECYSPNGWARVLGREGHIRRLINNYEYISFNFGPTLLSWLQRRQAKTYQRILEADAASRRRFDGHGNAMAQVYNHIIMPLANRRDKQTQIQWGRTDFRSRFGHDPEGMWLAETAMDMETLDLLAEAGLRFTILAPNQAHMVRPLAEAGNEAAWSDVSGGRIDPRQPYRVYTNDDRTRFLDLFFYDGPVSQGIAYERLLNAGPGFLSRIQMAAGTPMPRPRLVNLATDGESYGHHFAFGEMALAWLLDHIEETRKIHPINYGAFLDRFPPEYEVKIIENTAWSCAHGVERWRSDCGCRANYREGWNQKWRTPLREGFNQLRDHLAQIFETQGKTFFKDPWAARNDYISVILDDSTANRKAFLERNTVKPLDDGAAVSAFNLLESQKMAQYMFTSCAWFFDDIAGIEALQNLKYAARAIEQAGEWGTGDLETGLLDALSQAVSNEAPRLTGDQLYLRAVEKSRPSADLMVAHFGLCRLVDEQGTMPCLVADPVKANKTRRLTGPGLTVLTGDVTVPKSWNGTVVDDVFVAIHQGGLALDCLVGSKLRDLNFTDLVDTITPWLKSVSTGEIRKAFKAAVPNAKAFTMDDLFPDARHNLAWRLSSGIQRQFKDWIRDFFDTHQDLLLLLEETREFENEMPATIYRVAVGQRLESLLDRAQGDDGMDWNRIRQLAGQAKSWGVPLEASEESRRGSAYIRKKIEKLGQNPGRRSMTRLVEFLDLARDLKLDLDLWSSRNRYTELFYDPDFRARLNPKLEEAFLNLGKALNFAIDE